MTGADHISFCYQCGACVGDCPPSRFEPRFNHRTIVLEALLGNIDELIGPDSIIWQCSNCYNCYERCPQDVRPIEVIIALKNLSTADGNTDPKITEVADRIVETGRSVPVPDAVHRMRNTVGLPELQKIDVSELKEILASDG